VLNDAKITKNMETLNLQAKSREEKGKKEVAGLRSGGFIPAVVYGRGHDSKAISVIENDFNKVYEKAGESSLIEITKEGSDDKDVVLVKDVQYDALSDDVIHVDFQLVRMDEEVETSVNINFVGESAAVRELGGVLIKNRDSVIIRCLPDKLISSIEVDLAQLATFDDSVRVNNLSVPEEVVIVDEPHLTIAVVNTPRVEEDKPVVAEEEGEGEGEEKKEGEAEEKKDKK